MSITKDERGGARVLIDRDYNMLDFSAEVVGFFERPNGEPSRNLLSNVHSDLLLELRSALVKASQSGIDVDISPALMRCAQGAIPVAISVRHFHDADYPKGALLVIFAQHSVSAASAFEGEPSGALMEKLKASNEDLQIINSLLKHKIKAIRPDEERLRIAAETTKDYAIITMDKDGFITTWNAGAEYCFGYSEAEAVGQPASIIFTPEDRANGEDKKEIQRALLSGKAEDERWHIRKNGTTFYCSGMLSLVDNGVLQGFVKIARDMTGRKRTEVERENLLEQEKIAREKMEFASKLKDEFFAVVSHELKNPLNLIQVNAELLAHLPEVQHLPNVMRATETIRRTVLSQAKIIDDLLDLSRANTGKLTLNLATTDIKDSIVRIVQAARQNASNKNIEVEFRSEAEAVLVKCDLTRIEQILWNLLSNAIKFTPAGGTVTVTLVTENDSARLVVTDSGEGIAPHYLQNVFDMFNQGGRQLKAQKGGMGIGLALVRQLTYAHGGRVSVESPGFGKGATFTVWLPLSNTSEKNASAPMLVQGRLEGARLLVVDDVVDSLESLATLLRISGAHVQAVTSGALALRALEESSFDVLISDIGMDNMDGYELIAHVRKRFTQKELPAVALTGYGQMPDEQNALQGGFDAHLTKPTSIEDLMHVITQLLEVR